MDEKEECYVPNKSVPSLERIKERYSLRRFRFPISLTKYMNYETNKKGGVSETTSPQ